MGDLSKNFSVKEFFVGESEFDITGERIERIVSRLVVPILQPMRDELGVPIYITSGFRSPDYNAQVGGAANSHHLMQADRSAVDFFTKKIDEAWSWLKSASGLYCYSYWDKEKFFIHLSGLTGTDIRVGKMWIKESVLPISTERRI